jgi:hypothetical protein
MQPHLDRKRLRSTKFARGEYAILLVSAAIAQGARKVAYYSDGTKQQFGFVCDGRELEPSEFLSETVEAAVESVIRSVPGYLYGLELASGNWRFAYQDGKQHFSALSEPSKFHYSVFSMAREWQPGFCLEWRCGILSYIAGCFRYPKHFRTAIGQSDIEGSVDGEPIAGTGKVRQPKPKASQGPLG